MLLSLHLARPDNQAVLDTRKGGWQALSFGREIHLLEGRMHSVGALHSIGAEANNRLRYSASRSRQPAFDDVLVSIRVMG
jgi:hypothetical protein